MVRTLIGDAWRRKGFSILWSNQLLGELGGDVISLREFFSMAKNWPESLPAGGGDTLVVSGLEGCLDILESQDAAKWVEDDLKELVLDFQEEYEGQAGLIFWAPSGKNRVTMTGSSEEYFWKHGTKGDSDLPIGRLLFSGAENETQRILAGDDYTVDYDGPKWAGLFHPRIS